MTSKPEIKKDDWGKPIWVPTDYPFIVRSYYQSDVRGNAGWASRSLGWHTTLEEAIAEADIPLRAGETRRTVDQAHNAATWRKNGCWVKRFERKRGGVKKTFPEKK